MLLSALSKYSLGGQKEYIYFVAAHLRIIFAQHTKCQIFKRLAAPAVGRIEEGLNSFINPLEYLAKLSILASFGGTVG